MHPVELLAVVFVILHLAVRGAVAELRSGRIVVHALDDASLAAVCLDHLTDAAEVVAVVVVEGEVVLAGVVGELCRLAVALVEPVLVDAPVLHGEAPPEEVVRGVRAQDLRGSQFPDAADGDGDVGHRRQVCGAQFLARRAVDRPRHAAVGELDADGVVAKVVVYPSYPATSAAHEGARAVVREGVLLAGRICNSLGWSISIYRCDKRTFSISHKSRIEGIQVMLWREKVG